MSESVIYTQCQQCKIRIQSEWLSFHNCQEEEKLKEAETKLQSALDENLKLKLQNEELKKSVNSIQNEIKLSFDQMRSIVGSYLRKKEETQSTTTEQPPLKTEEVLTENPSAADETQNK